MMESLVSIIIPAYNASRFINSCLDSVTQQTYSNIEIIIINDGSLDETYELIKTHEKINDFIKLNRVKILDIPNGGVSNARNLGLELARGEFIAFLDSDDYIAPDHIETLINLLDNNGIKSLPVVNFNFHNLKNNTIRKEYCIPGEYSSKEIIRNILDKKEVNFNLLPSVCNKLFSKKVLDKFNIKFHKEFNYGEDWLFVIEYLRYIEFVKIIDQSTYFNHEYEGVRLSSNYRPDGFQQAIEIRSIIANWFPEYSGISYFHSLVNIHTLYQATYARRFGLKGFASKIRKLYENEKFKECLAQNSFDSKLLSYSLNNQWKKYLWKSIINNKKPFIKYYIMKLLNKK